MREQRPPTGGESVVVVSLAVAAVAAAFFDNHAPVRLLSRLLPFAALFAVALQPAALRSTRRLPLLITAYVAWSVLTYAWSADPGASQRRLVDLVLLAVVGWCVGSMLDYRELHQVVAVVMKGAIVLTFAGLLAAPGWATAPKVDGAPGWHSFFSHKNGLGAFAVFALVTLWFDSSRRRGWWIAAALVLAVGSQSSTSLALVLVLAAAAAWRGSLVVLRRPFARLGYLLSSWVLMATGFWILATDFSLIPALLGRGSTLSGRTDIWTATLRAIGDSPWRGHGFGGLWEAPVPPTSDIWKELRFEVFHAHSGYLDVAVQTGVVGLALLLAAIAAAAWSAVRRGGRYGSWAAALLLALCLNAIVESGAFYNNGLLLIVIFASSGAQARGQGTPAPRSTSSTPVNASSGRKRRAATAA